MSDIKSIWLLLLLLVLVILALVYAGVPWVSASLPPSIQLQDDGYVYQEDPCVEALRGAMERMEPFIPEHYQREGAWWVTTEQLTEDGIQDRREAGAVWQEAKLMCWRH